MNLLFRDVHVFQSELLQDVVKIQLAHFTAKLHLLALCQLSFLIWYVSIQCFSYGYCGVYANVLGVCLALSDYKGLCTRNRYS